MIAAIKEWLPITVRNRVALGFAFAALVMFVVWNFLPASEFYFTNHSFYRRNGWVLMQLWPEMVNLDYFRNVIHSPSIYGCLSMAARMHILLSGILVLTIVPLWRMIHASKFLTMPLAVVNLAGGVVILWILYKDNLYFVLAPYEIETRTMIALTMFVLSAALLIFKNELSLRHEQEVKNSIAGDES